MAAKGKSGPKTAVGKLQSSKNATTHGLSTTQLVGLDQHKIFKTVLAELNKHYRPQTPLQKMQLERIAIAKSKLSALYQLEADKLELARRAAERDVYALADVKNISKLAIGMLNEMRIFKILTLPLCLTPHILEQIVAEIEVYADEIICDQDLEEYLPSLVRYLNLFDSNEPELHQKLKAVANLLEGVIENGDLYMEHFKTLVIKNRPPQPDSTGEPEIDKWQQELEEYQEESRKRLGLKPIVKTKPMVSFPESKQIKQWLGHFVELHKAYKEVQLYGESIETERALRLRAVSLPAEELDLLQRYQVVWEKRLSSAVGEFLQLKKLES